MIRQQERRDTRFHHLGLVGIAIVSPDMDKCLDVVIAVKRPRNAILFEVDFARHSVSPNLIRFEDGSQPVVLLLRKGIVLVVMTFRTVQRQTQHCLRCMFNRFVEPTGPIEFEVLSCQEASCSQLVEIRRIKFIGRQHFTQHLIVWLVGIQRIDDPVSPMPDMLLRVPNFGPQAPPVTVTPDIHPVTPPSLSILRAVE